MSIFIKELYDHADNDDDRDDDDDDVVVYGICAGIWWYLFIYL